MDKNIKLIKLYDYYKELLTENQQHLFEDYYFDNLSLSEISENNQVSRNAIHKTIKLIEEKLLFYEEKLCLEKKFASLEDLTSNLDTNLKEEIKRILEI